MVRDSPRPSAARFCRALPAWGADVVSSNIVGYEKITLTPGLNMIGNQFLAVGGDAFKNINGMFVDSSEMVAGTGDDNADSILTWNGSSYNKVYYLDDWDNNWYDSDDANEPSEVVFTPGQGFWFKHIGDEPITTTLAGEVPSGDSYSVSLTPGLNFVANPYPMAICPNSESFMVSGAIAGTGDDNADSILTWNGSSYNKVYYLDDWDNKWYDSDDANDPVSTTIFNPAMGFWYKHLGEGATLTFGKPF